MSLMKRLYIIMLAVITVLAVIAGFLMFSGRDAEEHRLILPYSGQKYGYETETLNATAYDKAYAANLCVGENDLANADITLSGNERGGLFSLENNRLMFAKGMHDRIYPASITKLMTAIVACKNGNMSDVVTINWQDLELESGSQVCGFKIGDRVNMTNLMNGLLVQSGNDAAMAIARHIGGTTEKFVAMMNEEANAIGATNTHFVSPSGLHDEDHYTSVYDIYLMLNEAMKYDLIVNTMQVAVYDLSYTSKEGNEMHVTLDSTDHYLTGEVKPPKGATVLGGKTGTTSQAGNCLALVSQNSFGQPFISVIVGAVDKETLYNDMNKMLAVIDE